MTQTPFTNESNRPSINVKAIKKAERLAHKARKKGEVQLANIYDHYAELLREGSLWVEHDFFRKMVVEYGGRMIHRT